MIPNMGKCTKKIAVLLILLMLTLQNHEFVGRQQHRSNAHDQEDATEGYYRINITIPFPDHLLSEFENRQSIITSHLYSQISKHNTLFKKKDGFSNMFHYLLHICRFCELRLQALKGFTILPSLAAVTIPKHDDLKYFIDLPYPQSLPCMHKSSNFGR